MSTEEQVRLAREGNADAAEAVLKEFSRMIGSLAAVYAGGSEVQDMEQVGLMAVAAAIKDYDEAKGAKFFTYAYLCAQRKMIDEARKNSRRPPTVAFEEVPEPQYSGNFDDILYARELLRKLAGVLSDFELQSLMLTASDMSYAEAAHRLSSKPKAVDNAVARARKKIKELR